MARFARSSADRADASKDRHWWIFQRSRSLESRSDFSDKERKHPLLNLKRNRDARARAHRSKQDRSIRAQMIISDAIIWIMRAMHRGRGNVCTYVQLAARTMNYARRVHLPFFPLPLSARLFLLHRRCCCHCSCCSCCSRYVEEKTIFDLPCSRGPIGEPSGIWTVIHKSQTCILVRASQRDKQNRHELRESADCTKKQFNDNDIVNFTSYEINFTAIYELYFSLRLHCSAIPNGSRSRFSINFVKERKLLLDAHAG